MSRKIRPAAVRTHWGLGFVISGLLLGLAPLMFSEYSLTLGVVYALLALSLAFVWGVGGILCFGQAAYYGLGAYAYAIATLNGLEPVLASALAVAVAAAAALALGAMMFYGRIGDVYLGVITLVATLLLFKYVNSTAGPDYAIGSARLGGFNGIPGFAPLSLPGFADQPITGLSLYVVSVLCLLLCWWGLHWLSRRPFGRLLAGLRENELRAELSGYDVRLAKTLTFGLGGAIAGLAGVLYACWAEIVTPELFSLGVSAEIIIWVLVGGLGTLWGPMCAAILLVALKGFLGGQQMVDSGLVMGLLLIAVVLFLPRGLLPLLLRWSGRHE
jgi:ABC-type branched-subunit amino acid transport system permease subunit